MENDNFSVYTFKVCCMENDNSSVYSTLDGE